MFYVYEANRENLIREHEQRAGLPCNKVNLIGGVVQHDTSNRALPEPIRLKIQSPSKNENEFAADPTIPRARKTLH